MSIFQPPPPMAQAPPPAGYPPPQAPPPGQVSECHLSMVLRKTLDLVASTHALYTHSRYMTLIGVLY